MCRNVDSANCVENFDSPSEKAFKGTKIVNSIEFNVICRGKLTNVLSKISAVRMSVESEVVCMRLVSSFSFSAPFYHWRPLLI